LGIIDRSVGGPMMNALSAVQAKAAKPMAGRLQTETTQPYENT